MEKGYLAIGSIFCAAMLISCGAIDNGAYQPSSMDEYAAGAPAGDGSSAQNLSGEFSFTEAGSESAYIVSSASYFYDGSRPVISSEYPAPNAVGVGISDHIVLSFSEEMDAATINANTVKVIRKDNGTIVPCRYVYANRRAVIKPIMKFSFTDTDVAVSGLKQDNQYTIVLKAAHIRDASGEASILLHLSGFSKQLISITVFIF